MQCLILRPGEAGRSLVASFNRVGYRAEQLELVQFFAGPEASLLSQKLALLKQGDIVIAFSKQALLFAYQENVSDLLWPRDLLYFAVGSSTRALFERIIGSKVEAPSESSGSEALLLLPALQTVSGKKILLLQTGKGRYLVAETLKERGGTLILCETYTTVEVAESAIQSFAFSCQIPTAIIATSGSLLQRFHLLTKKNRIQSFERTALFVVSERLRKLAAMLNWDEVIVVNHPSNNNLFQAVHEYFQASGIR